MYVLTEECHHGFNTDIKVCSSSKIILELHVRFLYNEITYHQLDILSREGVVFDVKKGNNYVVLRIVEVEEV